MNDRIVIIGAGLMGTTTAFELATRGHEVVVVDEAREAGAGTSHANGGFVIPAGAHPWNRPGFLGHFFRATFHAAVGRGGGVAYRYGGMLRMLPWLARFMRSSTADGHQHALNALLALGELSVRRMAEIRAAVPIEYAARTCGSLIAFRSAADIEKERRMLPVLERAGLEGQLLDRSATLDIEPALAGMGDELAGGFYAPGDESGDSGMFCRSLAGELQRLGVAFRFNTGVSRILVRDGAVAGVESAEGPIAAQRVIVCAGHNTPAMMRPLGQRIVIGNVKGYSLTLDGSTCTSPLPKVPIHDDANYGGVVMLGDRIRIAGVAEFGAGDLREDERRYAHLFRLFAGLFPRLAEEVDRSTEMRWTGIRPVSADGIPYIGQSAVDGLWVNAGHGSLGFTLSAGSAHLLADRIEGRRADIDPTPYRVQR